MTLAMLSVGMEAPDFELPSSPTGETFRLSEQRGQRAVVVSFVPAAFSPICSSQLPMLETMQDTFAAQNAMTVAIATDSAWALKAWKEQLGVSYPVLSDFQPMGETARNYGVLLERLNMANRVVVVVDQMGMIAWIQAEQHLMSNVPNYDPIFACLGS